MNKARKDFYTSFIEENSCDQRKLFKASKSILYCKPCNAIPPDIDEKQFAENIGKFFVQKVLDIRKRLDNIHSTCEHETPIPDVAPLVQDIREFDKLTDNELKLIMIMQRSSLRSCLLDPIPSWLVKVAPYSFLTARELVSKSRDGASFKKSTRKSRATSTTASNSHWSNFSNHRCSFPMC